MNSKTLLVLLVLAAGIGGAVFWRSKSGKEAVVLDPLRDITYADLTVIECRRRAGQPWKLTREDGAWMLESPEIGAGKKSRASVAPVMSMIGILENSRPLTSVAAKSINLGERGLDPPEAVVTLTAGRVKVEVDIGLPDIREEVGYRRSGSNDVFIGDARLAEIWRASPMDLRDPALFPVGFAAVKKIVFGSGNGGAFEVERVAAKWRVQAGGRFLRGDQGRCDQFVQRIVSLTGQPIAQDRTKTGAEIRRATIQTAGDGAPVEFAIVELFEGQRKYFGVKLLDSGEIFAPREDLTTLAAETGDRMRDPHPFGLREDEVSAVTIEGPGRGELGALALSHRERNWSITLPNGRRQRVDPERFTAFRDRLIGARCEEFSASVGNLEPFLVVKMDSAATTDVPPLIIEVMRETTSSRHFVKRSDEGDYGRLAADDVGILLEPYWNVMRTALEFGNDAQISLVTIADKERKTFDIIHESEKTWKVGTKEVPYAAMMGLLGKLVNFTAYRFIGRPDEATKRALEKPIWTVAWRHADGVQPPPPAPPKYTEFEWRIGPLVDESYYVCSLSTYTDLVFLIRGEELNLIKDVMRHLVD